MAGAFRPHVLGIDDGPFDKRNDVRVPLVGVMMEGHDLVESVARTEFPVDGAGVAEYLADWVAGLRCVPGLHAIVLGGVTVAGLAVVDVEWLSSRLGTPVLVVNRQDPRNERLNEALTAAGLGERIPIVERSPAARRLESGLHVAAAGIEPAAAARIVAAICGKSKLPEPLRVAHLIAAAIVNGQSRGRP